MYRLFSTVEMQITGKKTGKMKKAFFSQISKRFFASTVENNLYKVYVSEKYIKRAFDYTKNNYRIMWSENAGTIKIPGKHLIYDKTGYCTRLLYWFQQSVLFLFTTKRA